MKKTYLPQPHGNPATNNPRRVLTAFPIEADLARSSGSFECFQIQEPDLVFGGSRRCVDPRTGLAAFGPYGETHPSQVRNVSFGFVGTAEDIQGALKHLGEISRPIEQDPDVDCVLHPSFPGLNAGDPFRINLVTKPQWLRPFTREDLCMIDERRDSLGRLQLLQKVCANAARTVSDLQDAPEIILCAVKGFGYSESASRKSIRALEVGLQAECVGARLVIAARAGEQGESGGQPDRATRAWDLSLALLSSAGIVPWRLADASEESCFIGISFRRVSGEATSEVVQSVANVVTETGKIVSVAGDKFTWDSLKAECETPHLNATQATDLLSRALTASRNQAGLPPRKVSIHKSTTYSEEERNGFEEALRGVPRYGLMMIRQPGIFCVRPGLNPIRRGTAIPFDEKCGLIYTSGYVSFLRSSATKRMPQPLEIAENSGSISFREAARDIIRLTKLDYTSSEFCPDLPVTIGASQELRKL
jgi:hypothetical protein